MIYIIIELPSGFIDEYKFKNENDLNLFKEQNPDCKYGIARKYQLFETTEN